VTSRKLSIGPSSSGWVRRSFAAIAAASVLTGCAEDPVAVGAEQQPPKQQAVSADCPGGGRQSVTIGVQPDDFRATGGEIDGFRVAIACEVVKRVFGEDVTVTWQLLRQDQHDALEQGAVDLVVAVPEDYAKQRTKVGVSRPYYISGPNVLVADGKLTEFDDIDRPNKKVCDVEFGLAAEFRAAFDIVERDSIDECVTMLRAGEVDGVAGDAADLADLAADGGDGLQLLDIRDKVAEDANLQTRMLEYSIGVNPAKPDLLNEIDAALGEVMSDGTWQKFFQRYLEPVRFPHVQPPRAS